MICVSFFLKRWVRFRPELGGMIADMFGLVGKNRRGPFVDIGLPKESRERRGVCVRPVVFSEGVLVIPRSDVV